MNRGVCIGVLAIAAVAATMALAGGSVASVRGAVPPVPPATDFSARVDNPWFPLKPGTTYTYRGEKDGQPSRDVVTVTHQTRVIDGVPCVVIQDRPRFATCWRA